MKSAGNDKNKKVYVVEAYDKDGDVYDTLFTVTEECGGLSAALRLGESLKESAQFPSLANGMLRRSDNGEPYDWIMIREENDTKNIFWTSYQGDLQKENCLLLNYYPKCGSKPELVTLEVSSNKNTGNIQLYRCSEAGRHLITEEVPFKLPPYHAYIPISQDLRLLNTYGIGFIMSNNGHSVLVSLSAERLKEITTESTLRYESFLTKEDFEWMNPEEER